MPTKKIEDFGDQTIQKRLLRLFEGMKSLPAALMHVLENSYTLKFQVRDASVPDRVLWEKYGKLILDKERQVIVPMLDGLPITITLGDLLKSFRSEIEVKELPVFVCWEFQIGEFKTLLHVVWPPKPELIIVDAENPITLS